MFLRFKKDCRDGKTGRLFYPGDIREFTDERAKEILAVENGKFAEEVNVVPIGVKELPNEGVLPDERKESETEEDKEKAGALEKLTKSELVEIAERMKLPVDGNKADVIARILEADGGKDDNGADRQ